MSLSKRQKNHGALDLLKTYQLTEALELVKTQSTEKFDPSVDVAVKLGIDPKKSEQVVRGSSVLPHGTGKTKKVAVLTQVDNQKKALDAGADQVGFAELADQIASEAKEGKFSFDILIASPDAMGHVGKLARVLGPKGLMPNPKTGTVTPDVATAVKNAKAGQVSFRNDKGGIVHSTIGKKSFSVEKLSENLKTLISDIRRLKPAQAKGHYLRKLVVSSTMGPGISVDISEF
jgi:large subunit ribosomal protein L1